MPVNFTCPHCGNSMTVADQYVGQSGPCASCGNEIQIKPPKSGPATPIPAKPQSGGGSAVPIILVVCLAVGVGFLMCGGVLVALMLPAVQSAREAARRMQCANNMKQIGIALHNYHSVQNSFPPAYTVDAEGRPLHSWRTLLLPHLERSDLYDQIALDEPWDSAHNQQFADSMVQVFQCPSAAPGQTNYVVITGPGTMFPDNGSIQMNQVLDGLSNTLMVVETTGSSVNWMSPTDLDLERLSLQINSSTSGGIASQHPGGVQVLMGDSSVKFISESTNKKTLETMINIADGQVVEDDTDY